jgi:hypothetical protein
MRMERFAPYLGIVAALIVGAAALHLFFGSAAAPRIATNNVPAVSSESSSLLVPTPPEAAGATTTVQAQATYSVSDKKTVPFSSSAPIASTHPAAKPVSAPPPPIALESAALDASAATLRAALVNIICYAPAGSGLHSTSGSGVFIDPKGVILTNAHIAQHFLLTDRGVSCTIRSGSPAADKYGAALIYIPSEWINVNAGVLTQADPSGTGEYDFAFLAVEKSATNVPLPAAFPFIALSLSSPIAGTPVVIASYGAQFLESSQVLASLFPTVVFGSVKDVFTFATSTIDVIVLGGSAAAQEGSSGGGISDASGKLIGTITTSTTQGATDTRSLSAITASYIRSEYAREAGQTLDLFLIEPPASSIASFAPHIPSLKSILTAGLP